MTTEALWKINSNQKAERTFTVFNDATPPVAVNVTGWSVDAVLRARPGGNVLHTFAGADAAIVDATAGSVKVTIPAAASLGFRFGHAWYRVRVVPPSAVDAERVLEGPLIVSPD